VKGCNFTVTQLQVFAVFIYLRFAHKILNKNEAEYVSK